MTEHPNIASALVAALSDLAVVDRNRSATVQMKSGGSYKYEYADISDVVKLTRPSLAEHGLVALTPIHYHGDDLACTVTLLHTSGERLDFGPFPFPRGQDAQSTGSMVTYYRRYALIAALGMAAGDEDDDGASASASARQYDTPPRSSQGQRSTSPAPGPGNCTEAQRKAIYAISKKLGIEVPEGLSEMSKADASALIQELQSQMDAAA